MPKNLFNLKPALLCLRIILFLACLVFSAPKVFAIQAEVEDVSDRAYFARAAGLIDQAKESIAASLYQFDVHPSKPRHPGTRLADALIRAHGRGVTCYLLLNRNYEFQTAGQESIFTRNDETYAYLRKAGLREVYFADPGRRVHDKLLIVDEEWVLEGSHNWSYSAMRVNRESATLIRSPDYARIKEARVRGMERLREDRPLEGKRIRLPNAFLKDSPYFPRMVHDRDFRAMRLYLWFLYEADRRGSQEFEIDLDEAREWTDLPRDWDRSKARRQLIKVLKKKLAARYRLLAVEIPFGANARLRLIPIESKETGWLNLPLALFETGAIKTFSQAALAAYLTGLYLSETSPIHPWWSVPQTGWAHLFGISIGVTKEGVKELRRANVLEVIYFGMEQKPFYKDRPVSQYRFNRMASSSELQKNWQELREKFPEENYRLARRYARELEDPQDPVLVLKFLGLLEKYPAPWIEMAMARMRRLRTDNPRKSFNYVEGILEGWAGEGGPQSF